KEIPVAPVFAQLARDRFDDWVTWIAQGVNRMAETDHDLFACQSRAKVGLGLLWRCVPLLDLDGRLISAAMFGAAQGANRAGDGRVNVGTGAGDHATGKGRGIELVLGVKDKGLVKRLHMQLCWLPPVQETQKMTRHRVILRLDIDSSAMTRVVMPVKQHGGKTGQQPVSNIARSLESIVGCFRR